MSFPEMQADKQPFPVHTLDLNGEEVLVRPETADREQMGNVVIGDPRVIDESTTVLHREVVAEKTPEGKETLRITIRTAGGCSGGKEQHAPPGQQLPDVPAPHTESSGAPDVPAAPVGSSGGTQQKLKTFRPK